MRIVFLFFIAFIPGFCADLIAQNPYFRHYTTLDGLPTNTIYQIYQDSHKFIWFTSDAGVVKFDGSTFTSYRKKDGLSSNDVVRIKEDSKGRIWIFNYNGSVNFIYNNTVYNGKNAPFLDSLTGTGFILDFFTDSNQTIYFYNWQKEVFSLDKHNKVTKDLLFRNTNFDQNFIRKYLVSIKVVYLSKSFSGEWVIWCNGGIYKQSIQKNARTVTFDLDLQCRQVFAARNNTYYVKTYSDELIKVTGNFRKEKIPIPVDIQKIRTILEDPEGFLWIAAYDEGVYCLKNNKVVRYFNIKNALGLIQDHEQNIWISTQSEGVYVVNHDLLGQNHLDRSSFGDYGVNQLCDFPEMGIWCTTTKAAFLLKNKMLYKFPAPEEIQPVNLIYMFKDKTLALGVKNYNICMFQNLTIHESSKAIEYSKRRVFEIGTKKIVSDCYGNRIAMFDQNNIKVTSQRKPSLDFEYDQVSERINNAFFSPKNELVINAKRNYLFKDMKLEPYPELSRFDGSIISDHLFLNDSAELLNIDGDSLFILKHAKLYNLTSSFDTPFDLQINKILFDDSTLYIATLKDIFVCHNPMMILLGMPLHIESLNINFNNINDILIHKDTLYVASDDGLTIIAESSISNSISLPPIPYLQTITVNNKAYSLHDNELRLTGKNNIHLSFGCISYFSSSVIYSYKLEGAENKWTVGTGNGINLVYQNLPKGHYVFKLRVRKSNSAWSEPLELAITIKPTLTEYPAFWAVIVLAFSGFFFLILIIIRTQRMKRVEVNHQLIVLEQKALQSMMNPHFIFNSLGSIQNYLLNNKGSEAVIYLAQFSHLIRQNLNAINTPMIFLEEEVDRLKNYLDLEKKRLENKFDYTFEIDHKLEEEGLFIPGMIIQPIVENSIWHGLATLEDMGFIKITFQSYKSKSLKVIIEDNGIGMGKAQEYSAKSSQRQHLGMQILKKRLILLSKKYNTETNIIYSESNPNLTNPGTRVELILPFLYSIENS